ncbi:hypothetical protein QCA50_004986 [Cerrena zonata]|uniref:Uncharacterized protein n=1 Tax=Cerrena zonata TaxID=2478898 RepID=A0AAW0GNW8_9APHY
MAPLPPSSNPDVGPTLGALLIGTMLASIIYGITTLQLFFYFTSYSKDSIALKALVVTMWWIDLVTLFEPDAEPIVDHRILDTFDLAFIGHTLYTYFILDYLNPAELLEMVWTIAVSWG